MKLRRDRIPTAAFALLATIGVGFGAGCGTEGATKYGGDPPTAEATYGSCTFCHGDLAVHMTDTGGHGSLDLKCEVCHEELTPGEAGLGHRAVPQCADCHERQQTHHDPAAGAAGECTVCHTPHGSENLFLVNQLIRTPDGDTSEVEFTNLRGRLDGSFASVSQPGSGVCEICHTRTDYYRGDGTGEAHFPFACFTCHPHAGAFAPR
jgi:predicted CXXCH cytochrome family protein